MNAPKNVCFFHLDRPPVIYRVEIGKVVEKADWEHNGETTSLEAN